MKVLVILKGEYMNRRKIVIIASCAVVLILFILWGLLLYVVTKNEVIRDIYYSICSYICSFGVGAGIALIGIEVEKKIRGKED